MRVSKRFFLSGLLSFSVVKGGVAAWGEDLPWSDLASKLSPSASLVDTSPANYLAECTAELEKPYYTEGNTLHALIDQPSGLCMDGLFCAFESCYPNPNASTATIAGRLNDTLPTSQFVGSPTYSSMDPKLKAWVDDTSNPRYNLPSKVLFPVVASDVVVAVQFAKDHGLEMSVKNSGHSYVGASTKKDTLHINMNRYTHYAPTGVTDCDAATVDQETLAGQPCRLSLAKGKTAVLRIGGGENWGKCIVIDLMKNSDSRIIESYHFLSKIFCSYPRQNIPCGSTGE